MERLCGWRLPASRASLPTGSRCSGVLAGMRLALPQDTCTTLSPPTTSLYPPTSLLSGQADSPELTGLGCHGSGVGELCTHTAREQISKQRVGPPIFNSCCENYCVCTFHFKLQ